MNYAVNSREMKIYDRNTTEVFGIPSFTLMERASLKVADEIDIWASGRQTSRKMKALVIAGIGNNGGDGVCCARLLKQRGYAVYVCVIGDYTRSSDLLLKQLNILEKYGTSTVTFSNIRDNINHYEWDIIVDAMFGIGLTRPVSGDQAEAVSYIRKCKAERKDDLLVVSIDMPSGINADNGVVCSEAVKADLTVTFNQAKIGQLMYPGCEYVGKLKIVDAGITKDSFLGKEPQAFYYTEAVKNLLPDRKRDGNKGTNGKLLIVAGSRDISGACILCARAAFTAGSGMVRILTAKENAQAIKANLPEAMLETIDINENIADKLKLLLDWSTACVMGPGIGTSDHAGSILKKILEEYDKDLVLDADALNLVAENATLQSLLSNYSRNGKKLILTPHLGEFSRLFGCGIKECKEKILEYPQVLSKKYHCTVVCKDARTIVADSSWKKIYINVSGNDGMATAGSGDVLSGIMGALLAYKLDSFQTACIGTYIHGLSGDRAARRRGRHSMTASDIIDGLQEELYANFNPKDNHQ